MACKSILGHTVKSCMTVILFGWGAIGVCPEGFFSPALLCRRYFFMTIESPQNMDFIVGRRVPAGLDFIDAAEEKSLEASFFKFYEMPVRAGREV